jgi:hypothetical protein
MRSRKNRKTQYTVTSREVKGLAEQCLTESLPLKKPGHKCTPKTVFGVLLFAACWLTSIFAACEELDDAPSDQAIRNALRRGLPKRVKDLERKLNDSLVWKLPKGVFRRSRQFAIDFHLGPYYGEPLKNKKELYRSQPKQGTSDYHAYATVSIVEKGHRYTLGFTWVKAKEAVKDVVERLLAIVAERGVKIRRLLLDRGFYSFDVIELLQARNLAWIMPVVIRGRAPKNGQVKGLRALLRRRPGWYSHELTKNKKTLCFPVCVSLRHYRDKRGKKCHKKLLFAGMGVNGSPREIREMYRKRFGIETSYRQIRQAWAKTTTRDPWLRLLLVGIALIVRNIWVWLHWEVLSELRGEQVILHLEKMTFKKMLRWILTEILRTMSPGMPQVDARKKVKC